MAFTKLDTDYTDIINSSLAKYNITLINPNMYISGSFVLNLIQGLNTDDSDLDLYLNIYKVSKFEIENTVTNLVNAGYYPKKNKGETPVGEDVKICNKKSFKVEIIQKLLKQIMRAIKINDVDREYAYFSLRKHIVTILRLYNPDIKKEIDIIILKPLKKNTIQNLLLDTFDYDVVKNYIEYKDGEYGVYAHALENIQNNKTVMSVSHFKNRVLNNIHEFDNFITRYVKYTTLKKFTMFIDKLEITEELFRTMVGIYVEYVKFTYEWFRENKNTYKVKSIELNPKKNNLSKLFIIKTKKLGISTKEIRYDYNIRKYINERSMVCDFKSLNIGNMIFTYYIKTIINQLINKNHELYTTDIKKMINNYFDEDVNLTLNSDECGVCLEKKNQYDLYCGNNHKLCGNCLKQISNKCPFCRCITFR